ncbi:YciI family protein [Paenibacillus sp. YAF4_2]|uniref:YciI family protein n=1 Tax=Paenibacillus sp. YAF4_2 TaxID=3233085 RepID=UPI003F9CA683
MRYILMVKANGYTEARVKPSEEHNAAVLAYQHSLAEAGVLLAAEELRPSSAGFRITYAKGSEKPEVLAGPFPIDPALVAEFTLINVDTEEEALDWAMRMPIPAERGTSYAIELRRLEDKKENSRDPKLLTLEAELKDYLRL